MKQRARHPIVTIALAGVLVLASAGAAALGLGQIEVKSRFGQPLLAEIAIISSDPAELEGLRAGLASPETFSRIGLQPPRGIVADLQFTPALNSSGRPVIRVTSAQPVSEPLLTFLVEVDWGQGRLVREYSALLDAPRTVAAPLQPPIQAPVVAAPNVIERAPLPVAAPIPPAAARPPAAPVAVTRPANPAATREPARPGNAIAPVAPRPAIPLPVIPVPALAAPAAPAAVTQYGPIKAGESLSQIAGQLDAARGLSIDQSMIALLRANPDAFIAGNINQLKQGAILRVPASPAMAELDARQASALVRNQVRQWRQSRQASPAPAAVNPTTASPTIASRAPTGAAAAPRAPARLEIVPPGASRATRAGTQSGISAGGEGQMLRQELQQTKESLAARDAELRELKSRVADLEKLQTDQQQLLALRDNELAAAQQRLAASSTAAEAVPTTPAAANTAAATPAAQAPASALPWVAGGVTLLAIVLLGGWLLRRRRAPAPPRFRAPDTSTWSLADAFGPPPLKAVPTSVDDGQAAPQATTDAADGNRATASAALDSSARSDADTVPDAVENPAMPGSAVAPPAVDHQSAAAALSNRRDRQKLPTGRAAAAVASAAKPAPAPAERQPQAPAPAPMPAPAWHGGGKGRAPAPVVADRVPGASSMVERFELAQAYVELGDRDSARQLLAEVAATGNDDARQQASRMLRELE